MKAVTLTIGFLCAVPLIGLADPSGPRPGMTAAKVAGDAPRPAEIKAQRRSLRDFTPSDEQVADAERFFETNSPHHYRAYKRGMERSNLHQFLRKWIARNHLDLKAVDNTDPQLFAMKLDQLQIEDRVFGIVADAREKGTLDRERLRIELKPLLNDLVAKRMEEAAHRIERMKVALQTEQKKLDEMSERPESWIDVRILEEFARGGRLFSPQMQENRKGATGPTTSAAD